MSPGELKATAAGMRWEAHVPSSLHLPQGQGVSLTTIGVLKYRLLNILQTKLKRTWGVHHSFFLILLPPHTPFGIKIPCYLTLQTLHAFYISWKVVFIQIQTHLGIMCCLYVCASLTLSPGISQFQNKLLQSLEDANIYSFSVN